MRPSSNSSSYRRLNMACGDTFKMCLHSWSYLFTQQSSYLSTWHFMFNASVHFVTYMQQTAINTKAELLAKFYYFCTFISPVVVANIQHTFLLSANKNPLKQFSMWSQLFLCFTATPWVILWEKKKLYSKDCKKLDFIGIIFSAVLRVTAMSHFFERNFAHSPEQHLYRLSQG